MWYAVYRESDGRLMSSGSSVADTLPEGQAFKSFESQPASMDWNATTLDYTAPAAPRSRPIAAITFMRRFTMSEHAAVLALARSDDMVGVFLDRTRSGSMIAKSDEEVVAGLDYLVALGALTRARADEIYDWEKPEEVGPVPAVEDNAEPEPDPVVS